MNKKDIKKDMLKYQEMNVYEQKLNDQNIFNILGIDEVGRGPLAGPVVIAGVILNNKKPIYGLDDSKKLKPSKREQLYEKIIKEAVAFEIVEVSVDFIDQNGIANAITYGVYKVIKNMQNKINIEHILIDYMKINIEHNHNIIKKGDQTSNSIAAASIIAKVYRDNILKKLAQKYSDYSFDTNMGYGTKKHVEVLHKNGIINGVHRKSFEPVKSIIKKEE